jgi:hypothetical protein
MSILGLDLDVREIKQFEARLRQLGHRIPAVALVNAARQAEQRIVRLLKQPTAGWNHKVEPVAEVIFHGGSDVELRVTINDQIYAWVSEGTKGPYPIPKTPRSYPLRFQVGYKAKTIPGSLTPSSGGPFGPVVRPMQVMHPGIKPRKFVQVAADRIEQEIPRILQMEIERELGRLLGSFGGL